jgi:hypothetical protein
MAHFRLEPFDPCPLRPQGALDGAAASGNQLLALDIQSKFMFVDDGGAVYHEYPVPGAPDIQNCGGYVDKVIQYRDPALLEYLRVRGVSSESFAAGDFPILQTRSPKLDLLLFQLALYLRGQRGKGRVSLLDHGCTVAEHYDLLDVMLRASSDGALRAQDVLSYCGLDKSSMLLTVAHLLHPEVPESCFRLVLAEGSSFDFGNEVFDLSLSVGVVNHVANPPAALSKLVNATRYACVLALWMTSERDGFWGVNHSGIPNYFFSRVDLARVLESRGEGHFAEAEFIPETASSQLRSYIGLGEERTKTLGSSHVVYTTLHDLPFPATELRL